MIQFRAHFDGKNLCPDEPVSLPEGVTLRVSVEHLPSGKTDVESREPPTALRPAELFAHIESKVGLHDHPADWSASTIITCMERRSDMTSQPSDRLDL